MIDDDDRRLSTCCPGDCIPPDPVTGRVWKYQRTKANRGLFCLMIEDDCLIKRVNDKEDDIIK